MSTVFTPEHQAKAYLPTVRMESGKVSDRIFLQE